MYDVRARTICFTPSMPVSNSDIKTVKSFNSTETAEQEPGYIDCKVILNNNLGVFVQ